MEPVLYAFHHFTFITFVTKNCINNNREYFVRIFYNVPFTKVSSSVAFYCFDRGVLISRDEHLVSRRGGSDSLLRERKKPENGISLITNCVGNFGYGVFSLLFKYILINVINVPRQP